MSSLHSPDCQTPGEGRVTTAVAPVWPQGSPACRVAAGHPAHRGSQTRRAPRPGSNRTHWGDRGCAWASAGSAPRASSGGVLDGGAIPDDGLIGETEAHDAVSVDAAQHAEQVGDLMDKIDARGIGRRRPPARSVPTSFPPPHRWSGPRVRPSGADASGASRLVVQTIGPASAAALNNAGRAT